ncbi:hypothetical protein BJ508DRAFT_418237 [Ascobolus immersus RN42]|uniref:Spindle pole body component n=1 Tax=Ascobolus immersus RN42 TaxID=1160509 RepID=A0A3N4HQJ8_ASCIM|nr:hypothetical protein BJ508DRAFT_418237 [Ascobolus immersus RN42]
MTIHFRLKTELENWKLTTIRTDSQYGKERFDLLLLLFRELFLVLIEWSTLRSKITAILRRQKQADDLDLKLIADTLHQYCTEEEWKFEEHLEKIFFFSQSIVFFLNARAPSVEERILRYLYDPQYA